MATSTTLQRVRSTPEDIAEATLDSILMIRGLPTLRWKDHLQIGEYARMNTGHLENQTYSWVDDPSFLKEDGTSDFSSTRGAFWHRIMKCVYSMPNPSTFRDDSVGSRGVLRVKLRFES